MVSGSIAGRTFVAVEPEGWLGRLAGCLGLGDEIDVESDAFKRAFAVHAEDRKLASDVRARAMSRSCSVSRTRVGRSRGTRS